jgi:hypothetical protein
MNKPFFPFRSTTIAIAAILLSAHLAAAVDIQVDASAGRLPISPYIYGRNNNISDAPGSPTTAANIALYNEAGLRLTRDGGGNNSTKYNWRRKLSSHPDWYNNVYAHDWDFASQTIQSRLPFVSGLWTLQLLGKTASNKDHNFDDWTYNGSAWTADAVKNWAGGGGPTPVDHAGNPDLYLMDWPPDSAVAIFDRWFAPQSQGGLGLDSARFRYWNMDNEPEAWTGTHDDVVTSPITAEAYMQKYFAVAKKARAKFPGIKLTGPVFTNEWQWWDWNNAFVSGLPWMEFFIKRIGEEQAASGIRLLDVVDFHFYPTYNGDAAGEHAVTQLHRIWYDTAYDWPGANGSKGYPSGWDESRKKQFIFTRVEAWLTKYLGANHGVSVGISEMGFGGSGKVDGSLAAVWYASHLGTFADHGVAYLVPWYWYYGQWETLHLFSRYAKTVRVASVSSLDSTVSGYASINLRADSCTVILVNRNPTVVQNTKVTLSHFTVAPGSFDVLELSGLPVTSETFISHANNALKKKSVTPANSAFTLDLPPYSVTAVLLKGQGEAAVRPGSNIQQSPAPGTRNGAVYYSVSGRRMWKATSTGSESFLKGKIPGGLYIQVDESGRALPKFVVIAR